MKALHIPVGDEPITVIEVTLDHQVLAAAIGGDCQYVERVRTRLTMPHLGNLTLCVDETGLFHDGGYNARATALYAPGATPGIHGPALMMREAHTPDGIDWVSVADGDLRVVNAYLMGVTA